MRDFWISPATSGSRTASGAKPVHAAVLGPSEVRTRAEALGRIRESRGDDGGLAMALSWIVQGHAVVLVPRSWPEERVEEWFRLYRGEV